MHPDASVPKKEESIIFPEEWEDVIEDVVLRKGVFFILGSTDSGKTTLARNIIGRKLEKVEEVAFVDSDVGQSTLGPPATVSMAILRNKFKPLDRLLPLSMRFIGSISPSGHLLETVTAVKALVEKAKGLGVENIIVDTTGMVCGEEATALKTNKINLIQPDVIIAIEKEKELEGILRILEIQRSFKIVHLASPSWINGRSKEERRRQRAMKFRDYFQGSTLESIPLRSVALYRVSPLRFENLILGLIDGNFETLGLGVGVRWKGASLEIITPLKILDNVKIIQGGSFKIDVESGEEIIIF
ncbi:MAG TPA: hypothetical protein EYP78_04060 [Candidatus Omnitrophica bacterium]|nr:hypothetical protein [Candidatus Omnitrophota bacterium]